jgi:glucose-6-phosphate isomerase
VETVKNASATEKKIVETVKNAHPVEKITDAVKTVAQELDAADASGEELLKFFDKVGNGVENLATMVATLDK